LVAAFGVGFGFAAPAAFGFAEAFGLAGAAALGLADVAACGFAVRRAFGAAAVALGADVEAAAAVFRFAVDLALDRGAVRRTRAADAAGRPWSSFNPLTNAPSSRTSAVTSARRTVRLSRFLSVARPSRSRRRVSSSRAAASANSSHSRWRVTAATGVIAVESSLAIGLPHLIVSDRQIIDVLRADASPAAN